MVLDDKSCILYFWTNFWNSYELLSILSFWFSCLEFLVFPFILIVAACFTLSFWYLCNLVSITVLCVLLNPTFLVSSCILSILHLLVIFYLVPSCFIFIVNCVMFCIQFYLLCHYPDCFQLFSFTNCLLCMYSLCLPSVVFHVVLLPIGCRFLPRFSWIFSSLLCGLKFGQLWILCL